MTGTESEVAHANDEGWMLGTSEGSISESECWSLLGSAPMGRLASRAGDYPSINPVQFHLDGRSISVCLGQDTLEGRSIDGTRVGFAADGVDRSSASGWTVQVHGIARLHDPADPWRDCGQLGGGKLLRIDQPSVSGSRFALCSFKASLNCLLAMGP